MVLNSYNGKTLSSAQKARLLEILNMKTQDQDLQKEAIDLLHSSGSVEFAQKTARRLLEEAWEGVRGSLDEGNLGKEHLMELSEYLIERDL
mmetsp:Transcript_31192/g.47764  ORF Transcript_31192/g.47764 Transcript_31192/m.47764 type:complete len:91 (-) Transcript_31192:38-310(-)